MIDARAFYKDYKVSMFQKYFTKLRKQTYEGKMIRDTLLPKVSKASDPEYIYWKNIKYERCAKIKRSFIVSLVAFILLIIGFICITGSEY